MNAYLGKIALCYQIVINIVKIVYNDNLFLKWEILDRTLYAFIRQSYKHPWNSYHILIEINFKDLH